MGAAESAVRPDFDLMNLYEVLDVDENATKEEIKVFHFDLQVI
jgi:DnaJ-class molecular chaperone